MSVHAFAASFSLLTTIAAAQGPPNDNFPPIPLAFPSVTAGSTVGASTDTSLPGGCFNDNDVWYFFTAPYTGTAELTTCAFLGGSASYDTVINVWGFPPPQFGLSPFVIVCNDDFCGSQSYVSFQMTAGSTYHVAVGGYGGATGSFTLALTGWAPSATNDSCATATPLTLGTWVADQNAGANSGSDPLPGCASASGDVWFSFVAPTCGNYTATTCSTGTNFDTVVGVWQGSCGSLVPVACNDDSCQLAGQTLPSTVSFAASIGATYYVSVSGWNGAVGVFQLSVYASGAAPMALAFTTNGPGSIGYTITNGPPFGWAFTALSLYPGAFPNGWFHGIDISLPDLVAQWTLGPPFVMPLIGACGTATVGPFGGLPPTLTLYGVSLGLAFPGAFAPVAITAPASGTVP